MAARGKEQNKIIISGNRIYEEVILTGEFSDELVIGTTKASRIRFERSEFFCDFEIRFYNEKNGDWSVSCNRDIYIDSGSIARNIAVSSQEEWKCYFAIPMVMRCFLISHYR